MSRRRVFGQKNLKQNLIRITADTSVTVGNWISFDIFLVGGGGSGGGWYTWGYGAGGGGSGGECVTVKNLTASVNSLITVKIGAGGSPVYYNTNKDGNPGNNTTATVSGKMYVARGGNPGKKCMDENTTTKHYLIPNAKGWDERNDAIGAVEFGDLWNIYTASETLLKDGLDSNEYNYSNPYVFQLGIPEFHEEGNLTHAAGGTSFMMCRAKTSFEEPFGTGGDFKNTAENIWIRGGGGYGGGGAGAFYRSGVSGIGGSGYAIIRYWTYE